MKKLFILLLVVAASCSSDRKKETISNYIRIIWRVKSDDEFSLIKVEELKVITARDSMDILLKGYRQGNNPPPPLDTILSHIANDIAYNAKLLSKTNRNIDSLNKIKNFPDQTILDVMKRSAIDLKRFTEVQLDTLEFHQYYLKAYRQDEDRIIARPVLCEYRIKGHSRDTAARNISQTFFLSPDTKRIYSVKGQ